MSATGGAVVIGGSIGGLLAARVLSERYERVVILDRDELPDGAAARVLRGSFTLRAVRAPAGLPG